MRSFIWVNCDVNSIAPASHLCGSFFALAVRWPKRKLKRRMVPFLLFVLLALYPSDADGVDEHKIVGIKFLSSKLWWRCLSIQVNLFILPATFKQIVSTQIVLQLTRSSNCTCDPGLTSSAGITVTYPDNNPEKPCSIDLNECSLNPCTNAVCSESTTDGSVAVAKYKCTCKSGFRYADASTVKTFDFGSSAEACVGSQSVMSLPHI